MLKKLPVDQRDFAEIRMENAIYADKTKIIYDLLNTLKYVVLKRPHGFGKSLLISVLKNLFEGKKELFKGLWIEERVDWKEYPVIVMDFSTFDFTDKHLNDGLDYVLNLNAEKYGLNLKADSRRGRFMDLIASLHEKTGKRVVLLVDGYNEAAKNHLDNPEILDEYYKILLDFFAPVKPLGEDLHFVLFAGELWFPKSSMLSGDLNNLVDISMDKNFAAICGFTKEDLDKYFGEYKDAACEELGLSRAELDEKIAFWYDGYKFDGRTRIYNPFSMLNFFAAKEFKNFWFESGLPKLLVDFIYKNGVDVKSFDNAMISEEALNNFDVNKINLKALMFQTGYLTIAERNEFGQYILNYPNEEVRRSFTRYLLDNFAETEQQDLDERKAALFRSLQICDIDGFIAGVNSLLASIPYQIIPKENENYYSSLIYVLLRTLEYMVISELSSYHGRADAVIKTKDYIYIFEYKMAPVTAAEGINQIKTQGYADEFMSDPRKKIAVSFVVDREKRQIVECVSEEL